MYRSVHEQEARFFSQLTINPSEEGPSDENPDAP